MVKALLTAELRPVLDAARFFEPLRLTLKSLNVAKPFASVEVVVVPPSVPEDPVSKAIVTVTPALGTLLPKLSFNCTVTAGEIRAPAVALVGCCTKTN